MVVVGWCHQLQFFKIWLDYHSGDLQLGNRLNECKIAPTAADIGQQKGPDLLMRQSQNPTFPIMINRREALTDPFRDLILSISYFLTELKLLSCKKILPEQVNT